MKTFIVIENQNENFFSEQYHCLIEDTEDEKDAHSFLSHLKHLMQESEILFVSGYKDKLEAEDKDELLQTFSPMDVSSLLSVPILLKI